MFRYAHLCALILACLPPTALQAAGVPKEFHPPEQSKLADVIFAVRPYGPDGHYYANFGYYSDSPDEKAYPIGGQLCRLTSGYGRSEGASSTIPLAVCGILRFTMMAKECSSPIGPATRNTITCTK